MSAASKLAAFAAALAVLFGGGALAGAAIGPDAGEDVAAVPEEHAEMTSDRAPHAPRPRPRPRRRRRRPARRRRRPRAAARPHRALRFRIVDERGATVRDFDVEHEKRMHLIVARRDLTGFQHLHPEQAADGTLDAPTCASTTPAPTACSPTSRATARRRRSPTDLRVDGAADLRPLPAAAADRRQRRRLRRPARRRRRAPRRGGRPALHDHARTARRSRTEPYLGAGGHLVALREGDLAFLHVHPTDDGDVVASRPRSRPRAATACSCSSSTRAASRPSRSRRR